MKFDHATNDIEGIFKWRLRIFFREKGLSSLPKIPNCLLVEISNSNPASSHHPVLR